MKNGEYNIKRSLSRSNSNNLLLHEQYFVLFSNNMIKKENIIKSFTKDIFSKRRIRTFGNVFVLTKLMGMVLRRYCLILEYKVCWE